MVTKKQESMLDLYSVEQTPKFKGTMPSTSSNPAPNPDNATNYYDVPPTPAQDPNAIYADEIQRAMSEKNYKALLNADIAAYNLKMNTQKHLDANLAAQGLGSQGYGTTAHVGIDNSAMNLYAQNLENYNANESQYLAEAQERKTQQEQEFDNQLFQFLNLYSDGSEASIASFMDKYGYELRDGVWVNKQTGEPAAPYIQGAVQATMEGNASTQEGTKLADFVTSAINSNPTGPNSEVGYGRDTAMKGQVDSFYEHVNKLVESGDIKEGTAINWRDGRWYAIYHDGKFYFISEDYYKQALDRYDIYPGKETLHNA